MGAVRRMGRAESLAGKMTDPKKAENIVGGMLLLMMMGQKVPRQQRGTGADLPAENVTAH